MTDDDMTCACGWPLDYDGSEWFCPVCGVGEVLADLDATVTALERRSDAPAGWVP